MVSFSARGERLSPSRQNLLVLVTAAVLVAGLYTVLHLTVMPRAEGEPATRGGKPAGGAQGPSTGTGSPGAQGTAAPDSSSGL